MNKIAARKLENSVQKIRKWVDLQSRASAKAVTTVWDKRAKDLLAAFIVGNGLLDLLAPHERYSMWQVRGPEGMRKAALWLAEHPTATRLRGIVRVGIGLWLALRQYRQAPPQPWYQRLVSQYRLGGGGWLAPLGFVVAILLAAAIYGRSKSKSARKQGEFVPTIARVTELSATSEESFEDAINQGVKRATSTLRNVESAWIKEMNVMIENNEVAAYKVNMAITFILEEGERPC